MTNRNTSALVVALVALAAVGLAFAAGGAVAQTGSTDLVDDSVGVTNDTESVFVDVTGVADMNESAPIDVNVTVEGLAAGQDAGNGTVLNETTLSVGENATESVDVALSDTDRADYDSIHVTASTSDVSLIDTYDYGTVGPISGGGGGGLSGIGGSTGVIAILVVVAALVFVRNS